MEEDNVVNISDFTQENDSQKPSIRYWIGKAGIFCKKNLGFVLGGIGVILGTVGTIISMREEEYEEEDSNE